MSSSSDWILEIGPEAGTGGGRIVASGTPEKVAQAGTATSPFLKAALDEDMGAPAVREAALPGPRSRQSPWRTRSRSWEPGKTTWKACRSPSRCAR